MYTRAAVELLHDCIWVCCTAAVLVWATALNLLLGPPAELLFLTPGLLQQAECVVAVLVTVAFVVLNVLLLHQMSCRLAAP